MPTDREECASIGDDPRGSNNRGMFYCSAAVHDVSTYQTPWVSSPDLIMLRVRG
ncbi:hypothetical protein C367_06172 [Cryptococcus neoformans Ze90-1]|nr:hypothetical protein C367_06172 [Cryptococcus neoformans var. grubii Ze90-1]